jgi:predicted nucleic acid-binding protein
MPTNRFVFDASAWIEYLEGTEKGKAIIKIAENEDNEIFTSSTTVAEVISKFLRANKDTKIAITGINNLSIVIDASQEISIAAGQIHVEEKKKNKEFGMLDAFVAATAKKLNAKILTMDPDFKHFKEAIFV